jgi:hypothetical protein
MHNRMDLKAVGNFGMIGNFGMKCCIENSHNAGAILADEPGGEIS